MNTMRYLKFVGKLLKAKITKRRVPLIVILGITNKCNLNCWYCYGEHSMKDTRVDFTTEELIEIIRALRKLGTQVLQLQGGEPLLRDDLQIIINEAHKCGMVCDMATNGILIPQKLETVRLLDKICISLDGPLSTNDRNRGKGSYSCIIKGIEAACSLGLPVRISAVLTSQTSKEDIDWLISFASRHKVVINFSPSFEFIPNAQVNKLTPHLIPDDHLKRLFQYILICKKKRAPIQFTEISYNIALQWPFTYKKRVVCAGDVTDFKYPKCYHGEYVFFIDSDGSLYPCCNFWGRSKLNIRTDGLKNSILRLNRQGCQGCYIPAYIDRNLFFNGMPKVWWNYIKQVMRGGT